MGGLEEKITGSKSVTKISEDGYIVRVGAIAFQLNTEGMKDLAYLIGGAVGILSVEDEDMKKLILAVDSNNSVPLKTTSNNNIYTGSKVSTDDLMKLNQDLKHP